MKKLFIFLTLLSFNALGDDFRVEIKRNFSDPITLGQNRLRIWGFKIYDIDLTTEEKLGRKNYRQKFAIHIKYLRNFSKKELVDSSVEEIQRIDGISEKKAKTYRKWFNEIFVDVKKGDEKTVIIDKQGLLLYYNNRLLGTVKNREFGLSFADIWLSRKAKYQKIRNELLGL